MLTQEMIKRVASGLMVCALCLTIACEKEKDRSNDEPMESAQKVMDQGAPPATPHEADKAEELPQAIKDSRKYGHVPIAGPTTRDAVLEEFGTWRNKMEEVSGDQQLAEKFAKVEPGAKITVFFGTWCQDCYETLPPLWKTLDIAGEVPFTIDYVGLDEQFRAGEVDLIAYDIRSIPTFIVERDGREVGRFIERSHAPAGEEILALLNGDKSGILSTNPKIVSHYGLGAK